MNGVEKIADIGSYDDTWIGEVTSKNFRKNQKARCFNSGKPGHLKKGCRQGIPRNNFFF